MIRENFVIPRQKVRNRAGSSDCSDLMGDQNIDRCRVRETSEKAKQ